MKKMKYLCCSIIFISLLMFSMSLAAVCPMNGGRHDYSPATCTKPQTCDCGATKGSAKGHDYKSHVSSKVKVATADNCLRIKKTYTCTRCSSSYAKWTYDTTHNYSQTVTQQATCTSTGVKTYTCGKCGRSYTTTEKAKGHDYQPEGAKVQKNSTESVCTTTVTKYKCSRCTGTKTETNVDKTHSCTNTVTKEASCVSNGVITHKCNDCDYSYTTTIAATGHNYKNAGYTYLDKDRHYQECNTCGTRLYGEHKLENGKCTLCKYNVECKHAKVSNATCTKAGYCESCGQAVKPALGHDYQPEGAKVQKNSTESVCTTTVTKYKCSRCTGTKTETNVDKIHSCTNTVTKEVSCVSNGVITHKCNDCDYSYTTTISATGHDYKNAGYTYLDKDRHYQECNTCGTKLYGEHKLENGKCILCNYNVECKHAKVSNATCTKAGYCELCGQAVKPALGHDYQPEGVSTEKPTSESLCMTTITKYKCSRCTKTTTKTINNQHYYGEYIQNTDYHVRFCVVCGKEQKQDHKFVKDKVLRESTCIAEGEIQYKCSTCGYEKAENTKKVSHVYNGAKGYSSDPKYHYTRCQWCETVNSKGIDHDWDKEDYVCRHCNYVCKHSYETIKDKGKWKLRCTFCKMIKEDDTCDHDYSYVSDLYGHYYKCTKCKNVDKSKSGAHKYESKTIDLCNGYHEKKCTSKGCDFVLKTPHIYANGKCISCGSQNTTNIQSKVNATGVSIDLTSKSEDSQKLQEKLVSLGYDVGGADGIVGSNTIKALNQLLADQGSSRVIKDKNEITPEIFQLLMICEETRKEAQARINKKQAEELMKDLENKINNEQAMNEEKIQYAQIILQRLGYYPASEGINGKANSITSDAIKTYCISNGINVSDINVKDMDFDFLKDLGNATKTYAEVKQGKLAQISSGKVDLDMSSENQRMEIQLMLKASGYYTGSINGELDSNTKKALKQLYEDKGLALGLSDITDWSQVTLEKFAVIATTDKKGLEEFKRSDENDKTFMGAVLDLKAYYASHGFRYCMNCGSNVRTVIPSDCTRGCSHKNGAYVTDCSTAVAAYLYYYAEANGSETMMKEFEQQKKSDNYVTAFNNDGYINGVKYFEVVSVDKIQEGDILAVNGHVEIYAGSMANNTYANVYNAGADKYIANPGTDPSSDKHPFSEYVILRPISPDEVAKLDDQN